MKMETTDMERTALYLSITEIDFEKCPPRVHNVGKCFRISQNQGRPPFSVLNQFPLTYYKIGITSHE